MTKLLHITTVPLSLIFFEGQIGAMRARGLTVEVLASPGPLLDRFAAREGVTAHGIPMPRRITPLRDLFTIGKLWRRLRRVRPQIVHAHTPKGGLLGMIAAWLAGVPVRIYHIHGLPMMTATGTKRWLLRSSECVACRFAHQVLCVSHAVRNVVVDEGLCSSGKIKVLLGGSINGVDAAGRLCPQAVSDDMRVQTRARCGIPPDARVLLFVGRIVRDKGVEELMDAWTTLRKELPALHLLVAGAFEGHDPIASHAERVLRSDPRVHLAGWVDDTHLLYAVADVVTLPSYREGFPVVPLEAAAMALPVVATSVPGCSDAVQDGVTGTLVPPRDAHALAEAIRTYLCDPRLRRQHGAAGRARVLREFRQEAIWEALYNEYARLLRAQQIFMPLTAEHRANASPAARSDTPS